MNYKEFTKSFPQTERNKPLAPLTSVKIGGPAALFYTLANIEEFPAMVEKANQLKIPYFIIGGGSNIVFHDLGFHGLVIQIKANQIKVEKETIIADAGALLSQIVQTATKNNLSGMERLTGLPGTIGGAVRGNAGAFGTETKDIFYKALIYNQKEGLREEKKEYFKFDYRSSTVKSSKGRDIILRVYLKLTPKPPQEIKKNTMELVETLLSRAEKQPQGQTTGSFFKNPKLPLNEYPQSGSHFAAAAPQMSGAPKNKPPSAGYLLDITGCKGLTEGKAQVSSKHANWIMNIGGATQKDIIKLAKTMRARVKTHFGITLEPEVQLVGTTGPIDI